MINLLVQMFAACVLALLSTNVAALQLRSARVRIPPQCSLKISPGAVTPLAGKNGEFRIHFVKNSLFPVLLTVADIFGASKTYDITDPSRLVNLDIDDGIIKVPWANPEILERIPALCPRVLWLKENDHVSAVYDARLDLINIRPGMQLVDHDIQFSSVQRQLLDHFDRHNALAVRRVKIKFDYEDTHILDYDGPHPITGAPGHKVYEGEGGFYANFHYAVVPFETRYLGLNRQDLLNMAEGKLYYVGREDLLPGLRTHAFLPGPYLSKDGIYKMCEWGDTAFQAPEQEMSYENLTIWDWDLTVADKPVEKILLIVWEGDEEDWMIAADIIDPLYLTDDVVGTFVIERKQTLKPLVLRNKSRDFEIEVGTVK